MLSKMRKSRQISLLWVIWSVLVVSENGETLLSDPNYDELMSEQSASNLALNGGATAEARASGCHFKESFRGSWFQSGIHHAITIARDAISTKGHCVEKENEKYLMYNRRENCYRCLVFSGEKHYNILQFKESFCIPEKRSLREICSTITGDANLYTMFRLEAVPMDCPFKGHFTVSYNRGQGECHSPISNMDSCTKSSRLVFNYQSCPDIPGSESSVEELTCLASWKEGSSRYFLGLISYTHHASYEERFRCFVYERIKHFGHSHSSGKFHTHSHSLGSSSSSYNNNNNATPTVDQVYRVAQSGDASCNGLSSMEGSRTMILRRVPAAKPCQFPSWIQDHSHWHTLNQGSTFTFLSGNLQYSNFSELAGTGPNSLAMNAMCYQVLDTTTSRGQMMTDPDYDPTNVVIIHATSECKTGYVCTAFHQRDDNIMEIQFGSMARRAEDACQISNFNSSAEPYVTLVSATPQRIQCPNVGHFGVTGLSWNGKRIGPDSCRNEERDEEDGESNVKNKSPNSLSVGCSSPESMQIRAKSQICDNMDVFADYNCHGWWSDGKKGITYVVTTRSSSHQSHRPQRHCFAFRDLSWRWSPHNAEKQRVRSHPSRHDFSTNGDDDDGDGMEDGDNFGGQLDPTNGRNNNNGKVQLLEFSSFSDSCQRNVDLGREGDFAFNLTKIGHCSDINAAPDSNPNHLILLISLTLLLFLGHL